MSEHLPPEGFKSRPSTLGAIREESGLHHAIAFVGGVEVDLGWFSTHNAAVHAIAEARSLQSRVDVTSG